MAFLRQIIASVGQTLRFGAVYLDHLGLRLQATYSFKEQICRHQKITPIQGKLPHITSNVFLAPNASVVGDVEVRSKASIWYDAIIRGDRHPVSIGEQTSIGETVKISGKTKIGNNVLIEPNSILHSCQIQDHVKIGSGAIINEGATLELHSQVLPGAVVYPGTTVTHETVWGGVPAIKIRTVTIDDKDQLREALQKLFELAQTHASAHDKDPLQVYAASLKEKTMKEY